MKRWLVGLAAVAFVALTVFEREVGELLVALTAPTPARSKGCRLPKNKNLSDFAVVSGPGELPGVRAIDDAAGGQPRASPPSSKR